MKRLLIITLVLSFINPLVVKGQILGDCTAPYDNATALVNLLVNGVPFSNVTLTGFDCSAGYFDGSSANLALESGLVMATGGVESIEPGGFGGGFGGAGIDVDLTEQLVTVGASATNLNNLIVLEFDFIPNSDQISFQYVFASDEYPGYTCSQFNDIFGFFLSGPGITGPFSEGAINMALVPNPDDPDTFTDTPVIINTINSGIASGGDTGPCDAIDPDWQDYSVFFTDNTTQETVNFPGFTVPLTATSNVTAGEEYHIKLAIADVADGALNSAVFLQANSFISEIQGCMDETACNYNSEANTDDLSCEYAEQYYDCAGNCFADINNDGICDDGVGTGCVNDYTDFGSQNCNTAWYEFGITCSQLESEYSWDCNGCECPGDDIYGCIDELACNYASWAVVDDGECFYAELYYDCDGNCIADIDNDGICDDGVGTGCENDYTGLGSQNCNTAWYEFGITCSQLESEYSWDCSGCECPGDILFGCTDFNACNYNEFATNDNGTCLYGAENVFINSILDEYDLSTNNGFTYFQPGTTTSTPSTSIFVQGSNLFTQGTNLLFYASNSLLFNLYTSLNELFNFYDDNEQYYDCDGCYNDNNNDGVCDELEVYGCTDAFAVNYNPAANLDDGSCINMTPCECEDEFSEPLYLPDGSGAVYSTDIVLTCFGEGQVLTNVNDILSVDINIEHSYTGDLDILLTAPNGVQVTLFEQAGGGTWFGEATDNDATETNPGIGYDYGWSMNPNYNGTMAQGVIDNTTPPADGGFGNILNSDTYLPIGDFNDFIGTNLNGTWTITIVDNLMIDNGWIFSWGLTIDPAILLVCTEGCTNPQACNYNIEAIDDDGSCIYAETYYTCDGNCGNDSDGDGVCDELEILGCTDQIACNYNEFATNDNGTCLYGAENVFINSILDEYDLSTNNGFTYFQPGTTTSTPSTSIFVQGSNLFTQGTNLLFYASNSLLFNLYTSLNELFNFYDDNEQYYDCDGCYNDNNNDGVCDELEIEGCIDQTACNYSIDATQDDGSCSYAEINYDCNGDCINDDDGDGVCNELEVYGCTDYFADNYNINATEDNGNCVYTIYGCTNPEACNWDSEAIVDDGSCTYAETFYNCTGDCINDDDGDGICDELELIEGCTYGEALNYNDEASIDDGSCIYEFNVTFENVTTVTNVVSIYNIYIVNLVLGTTDIAIGDLVGVFYLLDGVLVSGGYIVYDGTSPIEIAVIGDDPTTPEVEGFAEGQEIIWIVQQTETLTNYLIDVVTEAEVFTPDTEEVIILEEVSPTVILGCTDPLACNYNPDANLDDGSCKNPDDYLDCNGDCINDIDMDGECDEVDYDDGIGIDEVEDQTPQLIKMIDVLGREQKEHKKGMLLFYVYDNGKVQKKIIH